MGLPSGFTPGSSTASDRKWGNILSSSKGSSTVGKGAIYFQVPPSNIKEPGQGTWRRNIAHSVVWPVVGPPIVCYQFWEEQGFFFSPLHHFSVTGWQSWVWRNSPTSMAFCPLEPWSQHWMGLAIHTSLLDHLSLKLLTLVTGQGSAGPGKLLHLKSGCDEWVNVAAGGEIGVKSRSLYSLPT